MPTTDAGSTSQAAMSAPPTVVKAFAQLVAGMPASQVILTDSPESWRGPLERVASANGAGRLEVFKGIIADLPDAAQLQQAVFAIELTGDAVPTEPAIWRHAELLAAEFPEERWVVEGLVPEDSLVILGGKKKLGKSWMALQMAQAIAAGRSFLDRATSKGPVLFFCLEDGPRRLQKRLNHQRTASDLTIIYHTQLAPLDQGGLGELYALIREYKPKAVFIDTLASAKSGRVVENVAGPMADLVNQLRRTAQELHISLVVVAHHGKATFGDPGDDVRGSSAVAAAADLTLGLYKTGSRHFLESARARH